MRSTWMRLAPPVRMNCSFTSAMMTRLLSANVGFIQTEPPKEHQPSSSGGETVQRW